MESILVSIVVVYLNLPNKTAIGHDFKQVTSTSHDDKVCQQHYLNIITQECFDHPNRFFPKVY